MPSRCNRPPTTQRRMNRTPSSSLVMATWYSSSTGREVQVRYRRGRRRVRRVRWPPWRWESAIDDGRIASIDDVVPADAAAPVGGAGTLTIREVLESDDVQPLAQLIEQATGRRYADFVSRKFWRRLAAGDAWVVLDKPAGVARLDCCFFARQGDWMRIAQLLLSDGVYQGSRILPRGWAEQMAAPSRRDPAAGFQLQLGIAARWVLHGGRAARIACGWCPRSMSPSCAWAMSPRTGMKGRIPGLIVAGIEDRPAPAQSTETDLSKLVPHH